MSILEVEHIKKGFEDTEVLKDISFSLEKGEVLSIIGSSGSGKTTLLRCLNFLETADAGTMVFDGEQFSFGHVSKKDIARIRRKTAFVFQNYNLFLNKTALENVTEGLIVARKMQKEQAIQIGKQALDKVGLSDRYDYYPSQLSGGQQQRVGIARALATDPEIIFFDEPTTGLDPIMADVINDLIIESARGLGATTLTITHDMASARKIADRIAMLYQGKIIWSGTVKEMDKSENPYLQQFIHGSSQGPIKMEV